jgi:hypothetical protein
MITTDQLVIAGIPRRNAKLLLRRLQVRKNGCWVWFGSTVNDVPVFSITRASKVESWKVHRLLYQAAHPEVNITGMVLAPTCGDKSCPNPDHQELLTRSQFLQKGDPSARRSKKLDWPAVRRLRSLPPGANVAAEARRLGIARSTAVLIRKNLAWRII